MDAIPSPEDTDWPASSATRSETQAPISPLAAIGAVVVLLSLWFGVVTLIDQTANQPSATTTATMVMARS
jgi:hypothetical protein